MTETLKLPVLPLTDSVLLPGMVVPVRLDEPEIQAAVDAARQRRPQGPGRPAVSTAGTPPIGTVAVLEQVGRLPSGEKAAVVRGEARARIGSGVTGPGRGAVGGGDADRRPARTGRDAELAKEYKALVIVDPAAARRLAGDRHRRSRSTDPGAARRPAGWASYLDDEQKAQLLAETDVVSAAWSC